MNKLPAFTMGCLFLLIGFTFHANAAVSVNKEEARSMDVSPKEEMFLGADTICVVGEKVYYFGFSETTNSAVIFDKDKVWVAAIALQVFPYDEDDPSSTKFYVSVPYKCLIVDFSDAKSLAQLPTLMKKCPDFERYFSGVIVEKDSIAQYCLDVDFPTAAIGGAASIRQWLVRKVELSNSNDVEIPYPSSVLINYKRGADGFWQYTGDLNDNSGIAQFAADVYFAVTRADFEPVDEFGFPPGLFREMDLRAIVYNDRFVTYLQYETEYGGGMHGYYTEELTSFDHVNKQEIDFAYLFKPGCEEELVDLLLEAAQESPNYLYWNPDVRAGVTQTDMEGNPTGEYSFPIPGLLEDGVVFSFQPYEISCFAAGTFHFIIPYNKLKHLLTDRGRWCFGTK